MRLSLLILLASTSVACGALGDAWLTRNASPTSVTLRSVSWTGSAFIAAGRHGTALHSTDGITWAAGSTGVVSDLNATASSGALTVIAGDHGVVLTSANGTTWTPQIGPAYTTWRAAIWTGSKFVLAGDAGAIATSTDGNTWAFRYVGTMSDLRSLTVNGALLIVGGTNGFIATSSDGITWTARTSGTTATIRALATNGTRYVAACDNGVVRTSTDGITWGGATTGITTNLGNVFWTTDGAQFIATGADGICITSADGLAWTSQVTGTTAELSGGTSAAGTAIIVGESGSIFTSATGTTWTPRTSGSRETVNDATHNGTLWATVGESGAVTTSPTGAAWTVRTVSFTADLQSVGWNGSKFVAVGDGGTTASSSDGLTWPASAAPTSRSLQAIAGSPSQWVAVGEAGVMFASANGTSWSAVTSITTATWRGITWSGTQFVAVGDGGIIATSANGTSWTSRSSGVTTALESVTWNGTVFVATGVSGTVLTSANGISWSKSTLPITDTSFANLYSVRWDGIEFIAVGELGSPVDPVAWLLASYDGVTWTQHGIDSAPPLTTAAGGSGEAIIAGLGGAILQNFSVGLPELAFQTNGSSFAENAGTVAVLLTLSVASPVPVTVNFSAATSTALLGASSDAFLSASPLIIPAGQTTGQINVTIREDVIDEGDETVVINLLNPQGATLGSPQDHTLTITDNDAAPAFAIPPPHRVVAVGTALSMDATVTGDAPMTFQWSKNNINITGAIASSYLIPGVTVASAGTYRLKATNSSGSITSDPAELVVVDTTSKTYGIVQKNLVTFTISAAGNGLSYQWTKDTIPVVDDTSVAKRIVGSATKTLTIKNLVATDSGVYRCTVISPVGSMDGGANTLTVIIPPVVIPPTFPTIMISESLILQATAQNGPTRFTITGLPSGVTYNATTGLISGRPLIASGAQPFTISITASNAAGTSTPPTTVPLTVLPLGTGISGTYFGLIDREPNVNASLGGRINLIVSKTGVVTGSLLSGKSSHTFLKALDTSPLANPTLTAAIKRTGKPDLNVTCTLDPSAGTVVGSTSDTTGSATFQARRNLAAPFTGFSGRYTSAFKLTNLTDAGVESIPQGYSYTAFNLVSTGIASGAVRLADGTQFTFSTSLRNNGALALYAPFYTAPGSLLGWLSITPGTPALIDSTALTWFKPAQTSGRSYRAGFGPLSLTAFGSSYTVPTTGALALGLTSTADNVPNAALNFAEGGAPDPATRLNIQFRLTSPNVRDPQTPAANPGRVTVSVNHLNSAITGGFSLSDLDTTVVPNKLVPRSALYYGLIVRDPVDGVLKGYGHFQLPKMPDNLVLPATTPTTSPILSGSVRLEHLP